MILANIFTASGEMGRPLTSCADVKKFDFHVLLMTAAKRPKKFEFFYNEMRKCRDFLASVVILNAGYAMQRMNPDAFNKANLEFLSKN
jgi:hypothetical protein